MSADEEVTRWARFVLGEFGPLNSRLRLNSMARDLNECLSCVPNPSRSTVELVRRAMKKAGAT